MTCCPHCGKAIAVSVTAPQAEPEAKASGMGLTAKQAELLAFIRAYSSQFGCPPSFDEMKGAVGLRSKSGIHRLITALEERGHIRRLSYRARAIEVLS